MQILSKFCHNKHLTVNTQDGAILFYSSQCTNVLLFTYNATGSYSQKNNIINSKVNKY